MGVTSLLSSPRCRVLSKDGIGALHLHRPWWRPWTVTEMWWHPEGTSTMRAVPEGAWEGVLVAGTSEEVAALVGIDGERRPVHD